MSTTYSIACKTCKKHLWIAQSNRVKRGIDIYPSVYSKLEEFLIQHISHDLLFDNNCESIIGEYEELPNNYN